MIIKDLILKTQKLNWQELKDLQPVNLKNNYHSEKVKESLIKNGFANTIYVWENKKEEVFIVDGHCRRDVLNELINDGYDIPNELNCTFLDLPNKKTAVKYLLQVFNQKTNPINEESLNIWLDDEFEIKLDDIEINVDDLHIELNEVEESEEQEEVKEDELPEVKHNFVVKGDLFELIDENQGLSHRVLCGDSTMIDDVEKVMNGEKADMVFTDPPYGMFLDVSNSNKVQPKGTWKNKPKNYNKVSGDNEDFSPDFINNIFAFFSDVKEIFIWGADYFAELIINRNNGSWVVWDKRTSVESVEYTGSHFELCWSKNKHNRDIARIPWFGIIGIEQEFDRKRQHPTQKPINLAIWFFKKWGKENDLVADLYLGSGSTLIACQQTKRKCYGIELDEHYCGVVITRWKNYMEKEGKKYSIKRNGEQFDLNNGTSNNT